MEEELLPKAKMGKVASALGMADSRFEKGYFTTTMDDLAKLGYALMNEGVYGGVQCVDKKSLETLRTKLIALYGGGDGDVRYIFGTNVGTMVMMMNLSQKDIDFVITK